MKIFFFWDLTQCNLVEIYVQTSLIQNKMEAAGSSENLVHF
jgi:hypothetical protein